MRIILTGARGALGSYIADSLKTNPDVELFGISRRPVDNNGFKSLDADLLDTNAQKSLINDIKPDIVIHTAWETTHGSYWHSPENHQWAEASIVMAEQLAMESDAYFLFAGTCAECHWDGTPLLPALYDSKPHTVYGEQKRRVTHHLMDMNESGRLNAAVGRIFFPYSERENKKRVTTFVANELLAGREVHLRTGDVYRDVCHTKRVANAFADMALNKRRGLYNMCSDEPVHLGKFLSGMADTMGKSGMVTWDDYSSSEKNAGEPQYITGTCNLPFPLLPAGHNTQMDDIKSFIANLGAEQAS